jgi:hypothetical protein
LSQINDRKNEIHTRDLPSMKQGCQLLNRNVRQINFQNIHLYVKTLTETIYIYIYVDQDPIKYDGREWETEVP